MTSNVRPFLVAVAAAFAVSLVGAGQELRSPAGDEQLSAGARSQIEALVREKAARSKGRRKMDSQLVYGIKMQRRGPIAEGGDKPPIRGARSADGSAHGDNTPDGPPEP